MRLDTARVASSGSLAHARLVLAQRCRPLHRHAQQRARSLFRARRHDDFPITTRLGRSIATMLRAYAAWVEGAYAAWVEGAVETDAAARKSEARNASERTGREREGFEPSMGF
ncbi:MAG TPA: hypothetical protein VJQ52_06630 [Steroidobacteraceae bacterium]|nr:hypothetical protein [Steroidobacteraceae bacterium]